MKGNGKIAEVFAKNVFSDAEMKKRLPEEIYSELKKRIGENQPLDLDIANSVADEMKNWALEMGATHYTHWFQPMTGVTAEKHDSFLDVKDGEPILAFNANRMLRASRAAVFAQRLRRADIQRGIPRRTLLLKTKLFTYPQPFAHMAARRLIKRLRCSEAWRLLTKKRESSLAFSE